MGSVAKRFAERRAPVHQEEEEAEAEHREELPEKRVLLLLALKSPRAGDKVSRRDVPRLVEVELRPQEARVPR